ncbi:MAG: L-threonylcarbamoyladenylate synthase [Thermodesulfobacteriota bacterium]|nr:L-threonylcarbamoyladenylate synthase [Thermodesulfobacteriota bacterium]
MTKCADNYRAVDPADPDPAVIDEACCIISGGGVVAFPASTIYGLAADAYNPAAMSKVRDMKHRAQANPILVLVKDRQAIEKLVAETPSAAVRLMDRFWPGGVTLVFKAGTDLPSHLVSPAGTIGIRVPIHPVARALVECFPRPLTGTSANLSGQSPVNEADHLNETLSMCPDLILDAGKLQGGVGSTVIDVTVSPPSILRQGIVPATLILDGLVDL